MNEKRIKELEKLITGYQASYYRGEAEIPDEEFDALWDELKTLAPDSPVLTKIGYEGSNAGKTVNSVGNEAKTDGFPKARHIIPMGSQEKAASPEEFRAWAAKHPASLYLVQHKLDGASLELVYENGLLKRALTRGDGTIGDVITANARKMRGVIERLKEPFTGGVRGEVVMTREVWQAKYADKANCRNAANGLMRRKDGEGSEDLTVITYDVTQIKEGNPDPSRFTSESAKVSWLTAQGFFHAETRSFASAPDAVERIIAYRAEVAALRDALPYDIDGLVIKDDASDFDDLSRARPEKQIAFKFDLERAVSTLLAVEWHRSGATYTPIGVVSPVRLAGTTVQRANLNNPAAVREMGLYIGAQVEVVKRGEIIPKIERVASDSPFPTPNSPPTIPLPAACEICGTALVDAGTRLYCPNADCPSRLQHRIMKWAAVMDIREAGEKLLTQLFESGRVRRVSDLYTLKEAELAALERMAEISAAKVLRNIMTPKTVPLSVFVAGFDIENIAVNTMEPLVEAGFDTLEGLRAASVEQMAAVYGWGEVTAKNLYEGLRETEADMDAVLQAGVIRIAPPASGALRGKSFCFTGELRTMKRAEAQALVREAGGAAKSSVVKGLSYLVTNDAASASAKNRKAAALGVKVIDEEAFLALVNGGASPAKSALFE